MPLWGGLRPIPSRLALDALALLSLFYCAAVPPDDVQAAILAVTYAATLGTLTRAGGPTLRWTLTLPMVPFLVLQLLRRLDAVSGSRALATAASVTGAMIVSLAAALTVLFPAVELGTVAGEGRYGVGVVDLHLPVDFSDARRRSSLLGTESFAESSTDGDSDRGGGGGGGGGGRGYVTARLLYPTSDRPASSAVPYLDPSTAPNLCAELMGLGAPGPLKRMGFMLHTWRLTRIPARRNAAPIRPGDGERIPLAVYSHGLVGTSAIYTYQALTLAGDGTAVLMVDHTDGSAPLVRRSDGSLLPFDRSVRFSGGETLDQVRARRAQTDHRVEEVLAATLSFRSLDRRNVPDLDAAGVSFAGLLDASDVTIVGHSFGGATALTAASRRPDLYSAVVAHEPAVDWMPCDARAALFPADRLDGLPVGYGGGTGGLSLPQGEGEGEGEGDCVEEKKESSPRRPRLARRKLSLHDLDLLFLYSEEWDKKGWGNAPLVRCLRERGRLGSPGGASDFGVIRGTNHSGFSDTCMMTPAWLGRGTGLTGERNPLDSAREIGERTLAFVRASRERRRRRRRRERAG